MVFRDCVKQAVEDCLGDGIGQVEMMYFNHDYDEDATAEQFAEVAVQLGWDARVEDGDTVAIYAGPGCDGSR